MNSRKYFIILTLLGTSILSAQWNVNISNFSSATSNLINNYKNIDDIYFYPQFQISRIDKNFTIYYSGSTIQMVNNSVYNRSFHKLGLNYYNELSQDLYISAGSKLSVRRNRNTFSYYDYNQLRAFTTFKYYFLYNLFTKLGVSWQYNNFPEEDSWNHYETSIWGQINLSLPTKTAVQLYLNYRNRDFLPYNFTLDGIEHKDEISSLWLFMGRIRVAQSINKNIGYYAEYNFSYNPSEGNPFEVEIDSFSPIDDYFGYEGWNLENNIKYRFNFDLEANFNVEFYRRKYLNRAVYAYDFATASWITDDQGYYIIIQPNRIDNGYQMELSADYQLERIFNKAAMLNLELYLYYRNNRSNDPYFEYQDFGAGFILDYNFQW